MLIPTGRAFSVFIQKTDKEKFVTHFGRGYQSELAGPQITNALIGGLQAFAYAYNKISGDMPDFLAELEKLWPDEKSK